MQVSKAGMAHSGVSLLPCLLLALLVSALLSVTSPARADEIRPALLQLSEIEPDVFQVVWKVPAKGRARLSLHVQFGPDTESLSTPQAGFIDGHHVQRWMIRRAGGLEGMPVFIDGLSMTAVETLLRVQYKDGNSLVHRLSPASPRYQVPGRAGLADVISTYLVFGIEHILIGIDHLLFVLVLLLLVSDMRKLLWTITAFTVAHSITLSLAALKLIYIPVPPVEACIALSIVFVASEIIRARRGIPSLSERRPWLVAFTFGLLHGLGFASVLGDIGLPQTDIPAALLFFNVGVEIGQLLFVAAILAAGWVIRRARLRAPQFVNPEFAPLMPAYLIGSVAAFWTIERTVAFWG